VGARNVGAPIRLGDETALSLIRRYIDDNPARWEFDDDNPWTTRPDDTALCAFSAEPMCGLHRNAAGIGSTSAQSGSPCERWVNHIDYLAPQQRL
jgi:hypothetical protein